MFTNLLGCASVHVLIFLLMYKRFFLYPPLQLLCDCVPAAPTLTWLYLNFLLLQDRIAHSDYWLPALTSVAFLAGP